MDADMTAELVELGKDLEVVRDSEQETEESRVAR